MQVQVLVSKWCPVCPEAERIWREISHEEAALFETVEVTSPEGRRLLTELRIKTVPAVVVNHRLTSVGVAPPEEARRLLREEGARRPTP